MFSVKVTIDSKEVDEDLQKKAAALDNDLPFLKTWGNAVARKARENARSKSSGGRFWKSIARSVRLRQVSTNAVEISSDHFAARQKQEGGVITAKNAAALTIPITDEAKGKRASEFETGGRQLFVPKGTSVLGYSDNGEFHALYVLRKSVRQDAEPWFPSVAEVNAIGIREVDFWVEKQLKD